MKVKLIPITSYRVETEDGTDLGVFDKADCWQGIQRLTSGPRLSGGSSTLLVDWDYEMFDVKMFGETEKTVTVMKATGAVCEILSQQRGPEKA